MDTLVGTDYDHMSNIGSSKDGACNTSAVQAVLGASLLPEPIQDVGYDF